MKIGNKIAAATLIVTIIGIIVSISIKEIRCKIGLEKCDSLLSYTGSIFDEKTGLPIPNAKVTLFTQGTPITIYTDKEGIYQFNVEPNTLTGKVRVENSKYEIYDRRINPNNKQIEEIRLVESDRGTNNSDPRDNSEPPLDQTKLDCKYPKNIGESSVEIKPNKTVFTSIEKITGSFAIHGIPDNYKKRIGVVEASKPKNIYGDWQWIGQEGNFELKAQIPGKYQIRLFLRPNKQDVLVGSCSITIKAVEF